MLKRGPFTTRRKVLLAIVLVLLGAVAALHYSGAAGTRGMERKDMDWDGDGQVTTKEMLQSFYAVKVTITREGARECRAYRFRGSNETLRVDCRTTVQAEPAEK